MNWVVKPGMNVPPVMANPFINARCVTGLWIDRYYFKSLNINTTFKPSGSIPTSVPSDLLILHSL